MSRPQGRRNLTEHERAEIRRLFWGSMSPSLIAAAFHCSRQTVYNVALNRRQGCGQNVHKLPLAVGRPSCIN